MKNLISKQDPPVFQGNILELIDPNNFRCEVILYNSKHHSILTILLMHKIHKSEKYVVTFSSVSYFQLYLTWQGANFKVIGLRQNTPYLEVQSDRGLIGIAAHFAGYEELDEESPYHDMGLSKSRQARNKLPLGSLNTLKQLPFPSNNILELDDPDKYTCTVHLFARDFILIYINPIEDRREFYKLKFSSVEYVKIRTGWKGANFRVLDLIEYAKVMKITDVEKTNLQSYVSHWGRLFEVQTDEEPIRIAAHEITFEKIIMPP